MDSEEEVEQFLWSLCQGFTGDGWTAWDNKEYNSKLVDIRMALKHHVDSEKYARRCWGLRRDRSECMRHVSVDQKHCHHHR